jgi:CBS domain containing-hemolysin-like protein
VNDLLLLLIVILYFFNLVINAARVGLLNARLARLLTMREHGAESVTPTINLVEQHHRLRASLKIIQGIIRVLIIGLMLLLFFPAENSDPSTLRIVSVLFLIALFIWLGEVLVEQIVLKQPEIWALRFTPSMHLAVLLLYPIISVPLVFFWETESVGR